jgi:hypothetical protein
MGIFKISKKIFQGVRFLAHPFWYFVDYSLSLDSDAPFTSAGTAFFLL